MQIPCAGGHTQSSFTVWQYVGFITHVFICRTHGDEEYATEQGSRESRLHDLFVALAGCAVASQQRRDVEGHLSDGAKGGVHHRSHGKVTLCRDAVETNHKG